MYIMTIPKVASPFLNHCPKLLLYTSHLGHVLKMQRTPPHVGGSVCRGSFDLRIKILRIDGQYLNNVVSVLPVWHSFQRQFL
jgi:hypothetical protein